LTLLALQNALGERYSIERELARGGMATVYVASDRRHQRRVAIKVLDSSIAGSVGVDRFLREIQIAARLNHPHIVPLYDSGQAELTVFYVMPFVAGESLRDRLSRTGPLPFSEVSRIAREVASALDYAHREGIVHRDIKPENILISEGHAVVADFGIARALMEAADRTLTQAGAFVGTPPYMSPEQATGDAPVDGKSDQYSLACVLYELLSGRPPFGGHSLMAIIGQHVNATPPPLVSKMPMPPSAEGAIMRALEKDPARRFSTSSMFAEELASATSETVSVPTRFSGGTVSRAPRLPKPLTSLVGRDRDVQAGVNLLQRAEVRLLTLHGPGGIGKTRLAIEIAERLADVFPDGVWFVGLTETRDADALKDRIARAVGLRGPAGASMEALRDHLRDRKALLVLDNFEQLLDAAHEIAALLSDCPGAKALVTSQVTLRVYGEYEFSVEPLAIPDVQSTSRLDAVGESPSVQLFVQRATAARTDFKLDAENVSAIAEICAELDGVPLAIELSAARVKFMTPQALLPKLRNALDMLTGGARDAPSRQRTMRNAIAWTYDLLSPEHQRSFRRLSIFDGGATADAAAAVCLDENSGTLIDEALSELADHSLVRQTTDAAGETRFTMLRPIHLFASDALVESGERDDVAGRHAVFFRGMALSAEAEITEGNEQWLDRLEADHANIRATLDTLMEAGLASDALRTCVALWRFWETRSFAREGLERLRTTLSALPPDIPVKLRLAGLYAAGVLADSCGEYALGLELFEQHLELTDTLGDPHATAIARSNLGILMVRQGNPDDAIPLLRAALDAITAIGNHQAVGLGLANLGNAHRARRDFESARSAYEEAMRLFTATGDRVNAAWSSSHLGDLARDEAKVDEARTRYRQSIRSFADLHHKRGLASVLTDLGELEAQHGNTLDARVALEEALANAADLGDQRGMIRIIEVIAGVATQRELDEHALTLAGAVVGLRDRLGTPLSATERARLQGRVERSIARIGNEASERLWARGLGMSIEETLHLISSAQPN
jgi:predicted ATPase/tRNA A-37 threonylcarbamoyl transferase component Bud32/predicted negative regulator of RcsB-dependent stress response